MMERRAFISELAVAAVLSPGAAHAQRPAKTRRVGVLMTTTPAAAAHVVAAFADGLKALGHVEGKDVVIE
jgi:ABC-type nitrate/sulfonate/bicarbonate transport system substrate-binding protein